jgi:UDPglucose 6-dehydrogenase
MTERHMRTGVVGTGHVGLVTAVALASMGHEVVGMDSDQEKVAKLKDGQVPFFEPGLQDLLTKEMESGGLSFSSTSSEAVIGSEVVFISVATPTRSSGEANLVAVEDAAKDVAHHAEGSLVIVEKSTVPTGTAHRLRSTLRRERPDLADELEIVCNPEFLREGSALRDALEPERILIGAESERAFATMRRLYGPLVDRGCELIETDIATAELTKHASNAFLALKISFINAVARLCERAGADVDAVADGMGRDSRIGPAFLNAGLGYGGSCFPKDLAAFERLASRFGYQFPLLREVARINDEAVDACAEKVREALWNLENKRIALFGLAFKPGTDDVRFAPALTLARRLWSEGASVVGYDPVAGDNALQEFPEMEVVKDPYEAARDAHCIVLCTEWNEFAELDFERLKSELTYSIIVDGRNFFDAQRLEDLGFSYHPTGKPGF